MSQILHTWELGVQQGKYQERERIIALLQTYADAECTEWCEAGCTCYSKYQAKQFIELIYEQDRKM